MTNSIYKITKNIQGASVKGPSKGVIKMVNINNAVNTGVNNIKEEMKMENINNNGVNINDGRIYDEDWDLTFLEYYDIENAKVADDLDEDNYYYGMLYLSEDDYAYYKDLNEAYGVIEDFKMNPGKYVYFEEYKTDGWQAEFETYSDEVYNKFMDRFEDGYPEVMARRLESGWFGEYIIDILRKVASSRIWNDPYAITEFPLTVKETPYGIYLIAEYVDIREAVEIDSINYTEYDMHRVLAELGDTLYGYYETEDVDGYEQRTKFMKSKELKVIKLADHRFINEKDLWETIGAPYYTLPLIYAIENLITSYVENDELDEEVMNHTDEIIKTLVNKGEFIYVIKDGELHGVEGVTSTGIEAVELMVPYLLELEKAADELFGFCKVINNLNIRDEVKGNMMMELFADDVYSFVYQYCRDVYWDGGSN